MTSAPRPEEDSFGDDQPLQVIIEWKHGLRRVTSSQEELGRLAALNALSLGKSRWESAQTAINVMLEGRTLLFGGVTITIEGETFG